MKTCSFLKKNNYLCMANEKKWDKIYLICAIEEVVIQQNQ